MPCLRSMPLPTQGPFPPRALPRFYGTTGLSATLQAQPHSHELPVRWLPPLLQGFPCCYLLPLPCVPASLPRRVPRGARVARFPLRLRPSPFLRWVGPRIARFEACSTFTRVPARMLAEPPLRGPLTPRGFRPYRYLHDPPWLLPTGATVVGRVSHPLEEGAFPRGRFHATGCLHDHGESWPSPRGSRFPSQAPASNGLLSGR